MEDSLFTPEPVADWKRERDVFNLYAAFQDIPRIDNLGRSPDTHSFPDDFVPKPASDAPLAAFAQLAAMRLHAQRSMISLLDGKFQYILAEATPQTSLRFDSPLNKNLDILLGNVRVPRNWGLCEKVLDPAALADGDAGIIIIKDLSQDQQYANRSYVKEGPQFRFYAGVPIKSPNGTVVGSMCIFDGPERSGMSDEDIIYLQDLAATVMEYLVTYTLKDQHRRGAEGLHGLLTFAEADSRLQSFDEHYRAREPSPIPQNNLEGIIHGQSFEETVEETVEETEQNHPVQDEAVPSHATPPRPERKLSERRWSVSDLQDRIMPNTTRELFARAATIMRKSNDMDGVMFLDASVAATSRGDRSPDRADGKKCQVLGFATQDSSSFTKSSMPDDMIPNESNFAWLLKQYPRGYSLDCDEAQAFPWTDDKTLSTEPLGSQEAIRNDQAQQPILKEQSQHVLLVKALFPNIKSALFLPLWDFERNRWFAGCFCWSTRAERNLSGPLELPFLKAFGHSIMQELARLDAMSTNHVKTTFLSSLSHELRSPLHGILGSIQLMCTTPLDSFQASMVNSITVCGRTLLETVQHLLDHAERREPSHNYSAKSFPGENTVCIAAEPPALDLSRSTTSTNLYCNVGLITEEVVETMFLGQTRFDVSLGGEDSPGVPVDQSSSSAIARRRSRFIMVDIADYANLDFSIPASSYGRIVMNLLGNALKFTESGYILISLRSDRVEGSKVPVTLKLSDSGIGISRDFLFNDLFEPFRKQNPHSAGTGVGLSVVKRIIEDIGGSIEITSAPDVGTDITVRLSLERFKRPEDSDSPHSAIANALSQLKSRKICVLHSKSPDANGPPESLREWQVLRRYIGALHTTLETELKMVVTLTSDWDGHDESDIVICPEVSFESLSTIRNSTHRKPPATLFIAMDTMEADTLRCDARVTSAASVVEVVTQPCGPYKLGMVLSQCLRRYDTMDAKPSKDKDPAPAHRTANVNGSQLVSELGPRLGLFPPLAKRSKDGSQMSNPAALGQPAPPREEVNTKSCDSQLSDSLQILIVDDNAINRRLLSAFMKKRKLSFKQANDGLHALNTYREADGKFDIILMDISMPVMDGMTSTRLIREHENKSKFKPAHIIALTGLTSASAKLEAWTSGVDDFLTKPVDFKKLESLMEAGRGGEGTGFLKEEDKTNRRIPPSEEANSERNHLT